MRTLSRESIGKEFLWPLLLEESIAPFRQLDAVEAIIPWEKKAERLLDAEGARKQGYTGLAEWLSKAEALWEEKGTKKIRLNERLDMFGLFTIQMPPAELRVVYQSGNNRGSGNFTGPHHPN
jgi:hypothetical protein